MNYIQYPLQLFELIDEHHQCLLEEAAQQRLVNTLKSTAPGFRWWREMKQTPAIHDIELTLKPQPN